jgi:hypothetical protein
MSTPPPCWIPAASKPTYPGWVQRKALTLCKRDMTPQELLQFCTAVLNHSPNWIKP